MSANPLFTNFGLDAAQAYAVAYRLALTNALADFVVARSLTTTKAQEILDQAEKDTANLMLGRDVKVNDAGAIMALNPENNLFDQVANTLADEIEAIAEQMKKEENEHVASY